jgi:AAHS family 4-hydroxybenzoate transporter-like MFS transporter
MDQAAKVNLTERIDNGNLGSFQLRIIVLCALTLIMDGFDVQAMGYVAPAIVQEWGIQNSVLGPVFSAALVGVLIGSLVFSMLADRIGRRPVLIAATLYFSVLTLVTPQATSVEQLLVIRFIAGIGMGGIMPQAMALAGEYSPKKYRAPVMALIQGGFTAGAAFGGFVAAWLIPTFGWRTVFYFGGTIPLVLCALMVVWLPESLQFLVLRRKHLEKVREWLRRIDPRAPDSAQVEYFVEEKSRRGVPAIYLFREGRALVTLLLWVVNFMNLLDLYFLSSWLPTVVRGLGYSTATAVLVGTAVQVGGVLGTIVISWWITRIGFKALAAYLAVGWIAIALIGQPGLSFAMLVTVVFIAGWCVIGGQPAVGALAGMYYPTDLRSTGIGWGLGMGRIGAIIGPVLGGQLMAWQWTNRDIFMVAAVPALISMTVVIILQSAIRPSKTQPIGRPATAQS